MDPVESPTTEEEVIDMDEASKSDETLDEAEIDEDGDNEPELDEIPEPRL